MSNNDQYLYENMPKVQYNAYGIKKVNSIKILSGIVTVNPNSSLWSSVQISFGTFFSVGCRPVVVTGTQPTSSRWRWHVVVRGPQGSLMTPTHVGCQVSVGADYYGTSSKNVVDQKVYVHYVVIGW